MTEASLELAGLSRRFGSVTALDGLTFSVPPGQVFGFLGPNGAGKTTMMRAIFGGRSGSGAAPGPSPSARSCCCSWWRPG